MSKSPQNLLRQLPSLDKLLQIPSARILVGAYSRSLVTEALRGVLDAQRQTILAGGQHVSMNAILIDEARCWLDDLVTPTLRPVINATGVIVHTNLGRAPLSQRAIESIQAVAVGYSNLEYDENAGKRGSRSLHAAQLLTRLTGGESAFVANNNASAVMLMLTALCQDQEVIISRGQLVEIGGGFRVPDVMVQSGCHLVEVGTTNRTHLRDYENAITENTAAILVAHHSNYKIIGFTTEPTLAELAQLAHKHNISLLYDQGSGAMLNTAPYGLEPEPTVPEALQVGVDVVAFSGDKLLGGPQAGMLVGQDALVSQCKRHPLARAVRPDKLCLAALSATLVSYLTNRATSEIPIWQMIARPLAEIDEQATQWATSLREDGIEATVVDGESTVGGGSLPGTSIPTRLLAVAHAKPDVLAAKLRAGSTPVITRIGSGQLLLDPRTVLERQVGEMTLALKTAFL